MLDNARGAAAYCYYKAVREYELDMGRVPITGAWIEAPHGTFCGYVSHRALPGIGAPGFDVVINGASFKRGQQDPLDFDQAQIFNLNKKFRKIL